MGMVLLFWGGEGFFETCSFYGLSLSGFLMLAGGGEGGLCA